MSYRHVSQIRGFGTLSGVVGPNTARLAKLGFLDFVDETKEDITDGREEKSTIKCPVCWKYFDIGHSEADMIRHVENCLSQPTALPASERISKSIPEEINLVEADDDSHCLGFQDLESHPQNTIDTLIVGRMYSECPGLYLEKNQKFEISWQPDNAHDPNAIIASLNGGQNVIGHLPRKLAAKLGPLLRDGMLRGHGIVLNGSEKSGNVKVRLTLNAVKNNVYIKDVIDDVMTGNNEYVTDSSQKLLWRLDHIFHTVEEIESQALGEDEKTFLTRFRSHSGPCKILFIRLCQRNKRYFSVQNCGRDGQDNRKLVDDLLASGLLSPININSKLFSKDEKYSILSDIFHNKDLIHLLGNDALLSKSRSLKRTDLITQVVAKMYAKFSFGGFWGEKLYELIEGISGGIFTISKSDFRSFHRIQRLFFLNEGHSLATWHAVDGGFLHYPSYEISRRREVFPNRKMFLDYERSLFHAYELITAIEEQDEERIHASLEPAWRILDRQENKIIEYSGMDTPSFFLQYNSKWIYSVMATIGISILERKKEYRPAIEKLQQLLGGEYCSERRGYWWIRLSTNLEHIGRPTDSLELAETALADPSIRLDEKLTLRRRILKLAKPPRRWKIPTWIHEMPKEPLTIYLEASPLGNSRGERCKFRGYDSTICTVEQLALQYYEMEVNGGFNGIHSESGIWCTLFTLLLWRALFELSVPDTFRTSFQTAPLDLGHPGFYNSRKQVIDNILEEVRNGGAPALIEISWKSHYGVAVRGLSWERYELSTIQDIAACIGGSGISAVCRLLCEGYSTSGMPDLLLWNVDRKACKLAEVKSTRDTLSDKQRAWISFLQDSGIPCEVLKIKEPKERKSTAKKPKLSQHEPICL
jgi:fanconi-associated nuclease 1